MPLHFKGLRVTYIHTYIKSLMRQYDKTQLSQIHYRSFTRSASMSRMLLCVPQRHFDLFLISHSALLLQFTYFLIVIQSPLVLWIFCSFPSGLAALLKHLHTPLPSGWNSKRAAGTRWTCFGIRVPRTLDYPTINLNPLYSAPHDHNGTPVPDRRRDRRTNIMAIIARRFVLTNASRAINATNEETTKTGHMLRSECDLKMHARNLGFYPSR